MKAQNNKGSREIVYKELEIETGHDTRSCSHVFCSDTRTRWMVYGTFAMMFILVASIAVTCGIFIYLGFSIASDTRAAKGAVMNLVAETIKSLDVFNTVANRIDDNIKYGIDTVTNDLTLIIDYCQAC